jgi:Methyltransferase domain
MVIPALFIANLLLLLLLGLAVAKIDRLYRKHRRRRLFWHAPAKVPVAPLTEVDPRFVQGPLGMRRESEVQLIGGCVHSGTDTYEAWILAVLAQRARRLFEFGTCTGRTAYLWARNSPADARITTLTLSPDELQAYRQSVKDHLADTEIALRESCFRNFYYSGTEVEPKIEQLYGDSKELDETAYLGRFDLVFIDGSHAYSYVASDTAKALRMVRPGGLILWHDYVGPWHVQGVFQFLNELSGELPLRQIEGTALVYYRAPAKTAGVVGRAA